MMVTDVTNATKAGVTRFLARLLVVGLVGVAGASLGSVVHAQLLADVLMSAAISAQFDPGVSLPRGSMRAVGDGVEALAARLPDASAWTEWEAYVLSGVAAGLAPGVVHEIATAYAVAGYFETERTERAVVGPGGPETHTRVVFVGEDGSSRLLYVIRADREVVWLTAKAR
ncbi:MAG: hypothetical protein KF875_08930 [Trueperaceae bacterium]|nr:hypothetical protein [Trueperaceae bacterium]MCW5819308.1 hypothetical protein [Trueperaceae bacterium]